MLSTHTLLFTPNNVNKLHHSDDALMHIIHKQSNNESFDGKIPQKRNNEKINAIAAIIQYVHFDSLSLSFPLAMDLSTGRRKVHSLLSTIQVI